MGIVTCALAPLEPAFTPRYFLPAVMEILGPGEAKHAVAWSQLSDEQKHFQAAKMAVHAAMIDRMDREIGRVLDQVRSMGAWDNTIIFFLSDNGTDATLMVRGDGHDRTAAPGSAASFLCLGPGWSSSGNAPFRRHKIWTHEGGISTPLVVHWPKGIAAHGTLRHDVGHVVDFVPTLLELAGAKAEPPAGAPPFPGRSLAAAFAKDGSVTRDYVFFNHEGNRALRWATTSSYPREDRDDWELFNLATDRCEQNNLAPAQPDRVRAMAARWQQLQDQFTRDAGPVSQLISAASAAAAEPAVSLKSLLLEMIDRDALPRLPSPAYVCKQASSYDRKQTDPKDAKTWFANDDYQQFIRTEKNQGRNEWVIMEHRGPGAVVRFWTPLWPNLDKATVRFYLDGKTEPAIAANFNDLISGRLFVKPPLAFTSWGETDSQGWTSFPARRMRDLGSDLYLPIAFSKSCKITLDERPFYYAINYRAYDTAAKVESFSMAAYDAAKPIVKRVSKALVEYAGVGPGRSLKAKQALQPTKELALDLPAGPAAVRSLQVKVLADVAVGQLRTTVLQITFDGQPTVWCPLSEFFGVGPRYGMVRDWYRTVTADGTLTCRFVMPYDKSGRVTLTNLAGKPIPVELDLVVGQWSWDERSMHFHANWRHQNPLPTRPMSDWNYIEIRGRGVYAGDTLSVWNPTSAWYGEGDERIYVDGERLPSHMGTGTEDYYGYAWGMADRFDSPFIAMPRRDCTRPSGSWAGLTTTSRVRLLDGVPFAKSLKFDMEIWHWASTNMAYAAATFWYARPGATCNRPPVPAAAIHAAEDVPRPAPGLVECETLTPVAKSPDLAVSVQTLSDPAWSGGSQLFVQNRKVGGFIELRVPTADNDPKRLILSLTKSYDYGILRFTVNGQALAKDVDTFAPKPVLADPLDVGIFMPKDKQITLRVEVVGTNPSSTGPKYYFGLDCIKAVKP